MKKTKYQTSDGKTVREVAEEVDLSVGRVYARLREGETLDEIREIGRKSPNYPWRRYRTSDGKTPKEIAKEVGLSVDAVYRRMSLGESLEDVQKRGRLRKNKLDLRGKRSFKLVAVEPDGKIDNYIAWRCKCDCGGETRVRSAAFKAKMVKSCGCLTESRYARLRTKEGLSPREVAKEIGITRQTVHKRLGEGETLDEILDTGSKSLERLITLNGKTQNMSQWADEIGLSREGLRQRLKKWDKEKALTTPPKSDRFF